MTAGQKWHKICSERDGFMCRAEQHDPRCRYRYECVHHIVLRSHLTKPAMWLVDNGISLSNICHDLAHKKHNQSLPADRLIAAVDSVNAVHPHHLRVRYFEKKAA